MQLKFGYKDEGIRRKRFVSRGSGKIEDEYITGLLREEWIKDIEKFDLLKETQILNNLKMILSDYRLKDF